MQAASNRGQEGGPTLCGPSAEPPFVPESFAVLPSRDESRRLGDEALISYGRLGWQAPEVENDLAQSRDCG